MGAAFLLGILFLVLILGYFLTKKVPRKGQEDRIKIRSLLPLLPLLSLVVFTNLQAQSLPQFPFGDSTVEADRVSSVYGSKYNTHYSYTNHEWTVESNALHTFDILLVLPEGKTAVIENLNSLTIYYEQGSNKIAYIKTLQLIKGKDEYEIIEFREKEIYTVVSVMMKRL